MLRGGPVLFFVGDVSCATSTTPTVSPNRQHPTPNPPALFLTGKRQIKLAPELHKYGINVRHIGLLRAYITPPAAQNFGHATAGAGKASTTIMRDRILVRLGGRRKEKDGGREEIVCWTYEVGCLGLVAL